MRRRTSKKRLLLEYGNMFCWALGSIPSATAILTRICASSRWIILLPSAIPIPESLTYAPVDFERESLLDQLQGAGFNPDIPTFFAWLGVVPYLTLPAFRATLSFVAEQPAGSGLVLDYGQPRSALPYLEQLAHDSLASRVQLAGEPFQLFFTPGEIGVELASFRDLEDIGAAEINARYFAGRSDQLRLRGSAGRMLSAWL
jgi:O-methyltransferase involved in polyketide biosynthesis